MGRFLAIDIGAGTMDVLYYDSGSGLHYKAVSRSHAVVVWQKDQFILVDQSKNGTYVNVNGSSPVFIKQEKYVLKGRGTLGVARNWEPDSTESVHFQIFENLPSGS